MPTAFGGRRGAGIGVCRCSTTAPSSAASATGRGGTIAVPLVVSSGATRHGELCHYAFFAIVAGYRCGSHFLKLLFQHSDVMLEFADLGFEATYHIGDVASDWARVHARVRPDRFGAQPVHGKPHMCYGLRWLVT